MKVLLMKWPKFTKQKKFERNSDIPSLSGYLSSLAFDRPKNLTKNECLQLYQEGILGDLVNEITAPIRSIENFYITEHDNSEALQYLQAQGIINLSALRTELAIDCHLFGYSYVFFPALNIRKFSKFPYYRLPAYNISEHIIDGRLEYRYTDRAGRQFIFVHQNGRKYYSDKMLGFLLVIQGYRAAETYSQSLPPNRIKNELRYLNELGVKNLKQMQGVSLDYALQIPQEKAMSPQHLEQFKEMFLQKYNGPNGERIIFTLGDAKIQPISQTNREAEYLQTAQEFIKRCYNWARIPLALKTTEASTYNNFNIAKYSLIMDAVFPTLSLILQSLHEFLIHFWPHEKGKFWFNESDIPVMKDKREEEILNLFKNALLSEDEARGKLGIKV